MISQTNQRWILLLLGLVAVATSTALAATPLTLIGGDKIVWAYRSVETDPQQSGAITFTYTYPATDKNKSLRFFTLSVDPTSGPLKLTAVRDKNLYMFFKDGSHYRFMAPQNPLKPEAALEKTDFVERNLPNSVLPIALCGDDRGNYLWAVVRTDTANALEEPASTPEPAPATENEAARETPEESKQETVKEEPTEPVFVKPEEPQTGHALVSYQQGKWTKVTQIPFFFDDQVFCRIAADGGNCYLFFAREKNPDSLLYSKFDGTSWSEDKTVPGILPADVFEPFAGFEKVGLIVGKSGETGITAVTLSENEWTRNKPLTREGKEIVYEQDKVSVSRLGDKLLVAFFDKLKEKEVINASLWEITGGDPIGQPTRIPALLPKTHNAINEDSVTLAAIIFFAITLTYVFTKRQADLLQEATVPAGYIVARLFKRFTAFVIDALAISMVTGPLLFYDLALNVANANANMFEELMYLATEDPDKLFWRIVLSAAVFIVYATCFETMLAATPGKLALGLRVCTSKGKRCSFREILLRNVLRFELFPQFNLTGILIILTRNKQRVGDLAAGTIVIEKAPRFVIIARPKDSE